MKWVCWHQWNHKSSSVSVSSLSVYLGTFIIFFFNNKISYLGTWLQFRYRLHVSLLAGCISCLDSCLCVAGGVGKCRVLADLNPSNLKQHLVRGQLWSLALWQGEAERSRAPACPPSCIMSSPISAPNRGCCLCRAPAQQHAKALLLPLLAFYFLLLYFHLGHLYSWGGWGAVSGCVVAPSRPWVVAGPWRGSSGASPAGRRESLWGPGDMWSGQDTGQSWAGAAAD